MEIREAEHPTGTAAEVAAVAAREEPDPTSGRDLPGAVAAIRAALSGPAPIPRLDRFAPGARLNEDLGLDSVQVLNLLLRLETDLGWPVPDTAFGKGELATVADLARMIAGLPPAEPAGPAGDELDIKVHCVVSCLSAGVKARGIDQRPLYFGLWDGNFAVLPEVGLAYHAPGIVTHDHYLAWFERLYGVPVREWYDHGASKAENIATFERLLATKGASERVMVMLDLFHLPERENKFNQNPFPHYVMIEPTRDPERWLMLDPDFRWEGELPRDLILNAIAQPSVAGGYRYDASCARPPGDAALREVFLAGFRPKTNPLTDATRGIVSAHLAPGAAWPPVALERELSELPVLAIRKYAYEHAFAFFWRALGFSFEEFDGWCDEVEALNQGFRGLHYAAVKLARGGDRVGDRAEAAAILAQLDALDALELRVKAALGGYFDRWCAFSFPGSGPVAASPDGANVAGAE